MKYLLTFLNIAVAAMMLGSCGGSASGPAMFCDTACLGDTLRFNGDGKLKPWVAITASECRADTIAWSYDGMGVNRKIGLADLLNNQVYINRNYARAVFNDTNAVLVMFNDCQTGRGYQLKLPFNKTANIGRKGSALNNLDPKFAVDESLLAYTDRGNIFIEDILTGQQAMMTFGEALDIDYDDIHAHIDSVNVTRNRIWVRVKKGDTWEELESKITLSDKP